MPYYPAWLRMAITPHHRTNRRASEPVIAGRSHSEAHLVVFLAFVGALIALGIDVVMPAFDLLREQFNLSEGAGRVSLVVTVYFGGLALGQVFYGPFADRFGRRPVLTAGLCVYALGAVCAALAPTFGLLLAARVLWGLGAAACAALFPTMARDLYGGDHLARVMQLVTATFLLGPLVAPFIGELLVSTGWWKAVFVSGVLFAAVAALWLRAFGETLPVERRRPLEMHAIGHAAKAIFGTRSTMGYMAAITFTDGAFYVHLGAAQFVIDELFGLDRWFAPIFAGFSLVIGLALLYAHHTTFLYGARWTASASSLVIVGMSAVFLVVCLATGGVPAFWLWVVLTVPALAGMTVIRPTCISLALEPLERMAGTASGVIGAISQGVGAALATLVTSQVSGTVTPMAVGYLGYGILTLVLVTKSHRARATETASPA